MPRATQEAEGGDGDGEGCSGPPSASASHARTLPPPPYTTFPGSKPKFDWVSPPDGPERHFRFNGAGGGVGAPRRRAAAFSGPWGSAPPAPGQMHPAPGSRRPAPALLAPPMFIFPAPTNGEPVRPSIFTHSQIFVSSGQFSSVQSLSRVRLFCDPIRRGAQGASCVAPGKLGLDACGEGERVIALESW